MDALSEEKRVARRRYRRLQQLKLLLRCLEAVAALLLLSWSSSRLPAFAKLSGHLLRRLAAVLLSPRFVFLVGNAIVLLLLANSGRLHGSSDQAGPNSPAADIYDEYLDSRSRMQPLPLLQPKELSSQPGGVPIEGENPVTADQAGDEDEDEEEAEEEEAAEEDAEEFRQTIEAFIAKQLRFHREESMERVRCSAGAPESSVIACH